MLTRRTFVVALLVCCSAAVAVGQELKDESPMMLNLFATQGNIAALEELIKQAKAQDAETVPQNPALGFSTGALYQLAKYYYNAREFPEALVWYRKAAAKENHYAQFSLGVMYSKGEGVPKDSAQAVSWYRKAAEQGDADAQYNLGVMYSNGEGVPKDSEQAIGWWRRAAEQGDADAQYNLGNMYSNGEGVPKDSEQAIGWWRRAAEQGHARAQYNLGLMYAKGDGVPKDYVAAYMWTNLSGAQGYGDSKELRDVLEKQMPPAQIAEAQRLSREWKPKR